MKIHQHVIRLSSFAEQHFGMATAGDDVADSVKRSLIVDEAAFEEYLLVAGLGCYG